MFLTPLNGRGGIRNKVQTPLCRHRSQKKNRKTIFTAKIETTLEPIIFIVASISFIHPRRFFKHKSCFRVVLWGFKKQGASSRGGCYQKHDPKVPVLVRTNSTIETLGVIKSMRTLTQNYGSCMSMWGRRHRVSVRWNAPHGRRRCVVRLGGRVSRVATRRGRVCT